MKITTAQFVKSITGTDEIIKGGIPNIAFIGRSNVGKSSILNALMGKKDMARTGKKPGKTTEANFFLVNHTHHFVDLPGYGYAAPKPRDREKLRKLIIWYFTYGEVRAQKVVVIMESKAGLTRFDEDMLKILKDKKYSYILVLNKVDKMSQKELAEQMKKIRQVVGDADIIQTSTVTGQGIDALRDKILSE